MDGGTVKLPAVGPVKEKYVYAAGAAVAGLVGYAWWTRGKAAGAAADPAADIGAMDSEGVSDGSEWPYQPGGGSYTPPDPSTLPPTTNTDWSQRANGILVAANYDQSVISAALGHYLNHQAPADAGEYAAIAYVIAMLGKPPVGSDTFALLPPKSTGPSPSTGGGGTTPTPTPGTGGNTTPPPASGLPGRAATLPKGQSMLALMGGAHPTANAAQRATFALKSIHATQAHGIRYWSPASLPGSAAIMYKAKSNTTVYIA